MALAQDTDILLLDEPTTYLDLPHQIELLTLVQKLNRETGRTVAMGLHDINLAARFADRILLLDRGVAIAQGRPREVLSEATLEPIYGWPLRVTRHPGPGVDAGAPQVVPLRRDDS